MGTTQDLDTSDYTYTVGEVGCQDGSLDRDLMDSFKDSMGRFRTQSLFYETRHESYPAYFTTKSKDIVRDGRTYVSLYRKYMEISDPTEYQVALRVFGSWEHWKILENTKWFAELIEPWRKELKVKMESERYWEMVAHVAKDPTSPQAIQATKWLGDKYSQPLKRGRPSKEELKATLSQEAQEKRTLEDDAKRIGL